MGLKPHIAKMIIKFRRGPGRPFSKGPSAGVWGQRPRETAVLYVSIVDFVEVESLRGDCAACESAVAFGEELCNGALREFALAYVE